MLLPQVPWSHWLFLMTHPSPCLQLGAPSTLKSEIQSSSLTAAFDHYDEVWFLSLYEVNSLSLSLSLRVQLLTHFAKRSHAHGPMVPRGANGRPPTIQCRMVGTRRRTSAGGPSCPQCLPVPNKTVCNAHYFSLTSEPAPGSHCAKTRVANGGWEPAGSSWWVRSPWQLPWDRPILNSEYSSVLTSGGWSCGQTGCIHFPGAAATNHHKLNGLKQSIISWISFLWDLQCLSHYWLPPPPPPFLLL